jgi:N-acetylmuramoyl-L-alanine amidase
VDARQFGRRFGLSATWLVPRRQIRLKSRWTTIELTANSVEALLNGTRLFLSEPVVAREGQLYLSRGDVESLFVPILTPASVPRATVQTVVIDAGHGGADPGHQNRRLKLNEKVYTLDVARRLQRRLKADGFRAVLTRSTDRTLSLDQRAALAKKLGADLFVSIHFNGFRSAKIAGTETYVMTPRYRRSTPQAERTKSMAAEKFPANRFDRQNALLGYHVHRELVKALRAPDRGLKRFRYSVLRSVPCPAVLVEAAFLSNDAEARKVANATYRQRIADAVAAGVRNHAKSVAPPKRRAG